MGENSVACFLEEVILKWYVPFCLKICVTMNKHHKTSYTDCTRDTQISNEM